MFETGNLSVISYARRRSHRMKKNTENLKHGGHYGRKANCAIALIIIYYSQQVPPPFA